MRGGAELVSRGRRRNGLVAQSGAQVDPEAARLAVLGAAWGGLACLYTVANFREHAWDQEGP